MSTIQTAAIPISFWVKKNPPVSFEWRLIIIFSAVGAFRFYDPTFAICLNCPTPSQLSTESVHMPIFPATGFVEACLCFLLLLRRHSFRVAMSESDLKRREVNSTFSYYHALILDTAVRPGSKFATPTRGFAFIRFQCPLCSRRRVAFKRILLGKPID